MGQPLLHDHDSWELLYLIFQVISIPFS